MELAKPFIRLPYAFDAERLGHEIERLGRSAWMPHPSGRKGNSAVALISRGGGDNDDFTGRMKPTPHLERCEYHRQVMACFGEVLARSRLMKLDAGCEVGTHVDFNYHWYTRVRIHVPIITNPDVTFYCDDQAIHMRPGECWIFNSWQRHNVVNAGTRDRIHLVIDTAGSSRFWRTVRRMQELDLADDAEQIESLTSFLPYEPERTVEIRTERYNSAPVMAPGELEALVRELIRDFSACAKNDPRLIDRYRLLLTDLAKDWRELWHQYGIEPAGLPHYRRLADRLLAELEPDRRALVTASNDIGVNPMIVQRILRPALAPELRSAFVQGAG